MVAAKEDKTMAKIGRFMEPIDKPDFSFDPIFSQLDGEPESRFGLEILKKNGLLIMINMPETAANDS